MPADYASGSLRSADGTRTQSASTVCRVGLCQVTSRATGRSESRSGSMRPSKMEPAGLTSTSPSQSVASWRSEPTGRDGSASLHSLAQEGTQHLSRLRQGRAKSCLHGRISVRQLALVRHAGQIAHSLWLNACGERYAQSGRSDLRTGGKRGTSIPSLHR